MLRLLADENFGGDIVRGLVLHQPSLDVVRVQDVGLAGAADLEILAWAAADGRILLTHDRATMSRFAYQRIAAGDRMAGVFVINDLLPIGEAIQEILLMVECSDQGEWASRVVHLPL